MKYIKRFGIKKLHTDKYAICTEVSDDKLTYYNHANMAYKKRDFALAKAEQFIKACYKNFERMDGEKVEFEFINMGLIEGGRG